MKFRTALAGLAGAGVGYVLGARAGRARFDQIKSQAQRIVTDPEVRQKVSDLPGQVKENLPKAQSAVSDAIKTATSKVQGATGGDSKSDSAPSGSYITPDPVTTPVATGLGESLVTPEPVTDAEPLTTVDSFGTSDAVSDSVGTDDLGAGDLGTGDLGTGDLGTGDLGSSDFPSSESPDTDVADLGTFSAEGSNTEESYTAGETFSTEDVPASEEEHKTY